MVDSGERVHELAERVDKAPVGLGEIGLGHYQVFPDDGAHVFERLWDSVGVGRSGWGRGGRHGGGLKESWEGRRMKDSATFNARDTQGRLEIYGRNKRRSASV